MNPLAALALNDALGAQDHTVVIRLGELIEDLADLVHSELLRGFLAKGGEYLVSVVMVVVIVTAAGTALAMLVMMLVVVVVVMMSAVTLVIIVIVVMMSAATFVIVVVVVMSAAALVVVVIVVVMSAATLVIIVIVVMMLAATFVIVVVVIVVMTVTATFVIVVVVVMVMVVLMLLLKCLYSVLKGVLMLHSGENILAVKRVPWGGDDYRALVMLTKERYALGDSFIPCSLRMRENDSRSVGDLIVIELAKVLHIHLALIYVGNGGKAVESRAVVLCGLSGSDNVGKLANARGLDNNSVGVILLDNLNESLGEIANQRAADAARGHLGDLNARIGKETAVNTDLTKLVLDKNHLFARVGLFNKLLNQRGLTSAEEAGKYINFCHFVQLLNSNSFTNNIVLQIFKKVKITFL